MLDLPDVGPGNAVVAAGVQVDGSVWKSVQMQKDMPRDRGGIMVYNGFCYSIIFGEKRAVMAGFRYLTCLPTCPREMRIPMHPRLFDRRHE